jgi:uncharacterized delta-60 repeat protein
VATYAAGPSQGKVVVAGQAPGTTDLTLLVARFNADGSPDQAFGDQGSALVTVGDGTLQHGRPALAATSEGGLVVGVQWGGSAFLAKLGADGLPDPAFGSCGCGQTVIDGVGLAGLAVDASESGAGDIVLAGAAQRDALSPVAEAVRLSPDGEVRWRTRIGFHVNPAQITAAEKDVAGALTVDSNGNAVVVGYSNPASPYVEHVVDGAVRLLPDGSYDPGFGNAGGAEYGLPSTPNYLWNPNGVAADAAGGLAISAHQEGAVDDGSTVVLRTNPDGTLDPAFGPTSEGTAAVARVGGSNLKVAGIDDSNRVLIGGELNNHFYTSDMGGIRFNPDGTPDESFGGGLALVDQPTAPAHNYGHAAALDPANGALVVAGSGRPPLGSVGGAMIARFLDHDVADEPPPDPASDPSPGQGVGGEVGASGHGLHVLAVDRARSLRRLNHRGERVLVSCDDNCQVVMRLLIDRATASRLGLSTRALGVGHAELGAGQQAWVVARPFNQVKANLGRSGIAGLRMFLRATP